MQSVKRVQAEEDGARCRKPEVPDARFPFSVPDPFAGVLVHRVHFHTAGRCLRQKELVENRGQRAALDNRAGIGS
jgi:hypothetical protein